MMPALRVEARLNDALREPVLSLHSYTLVGKLRGTGRAEIAICLPRQAQSARDVVVVKRLPASALAYTTAGHAGLGRAGLGYSAFGQLGAGVHDEVELAATIRHPNIVRTLGVGHEAGRHFIVNEYLEGTTLRRLVRGLAARSSSLHNAAVGRILLGILSAVEHSDQLAKTPGARSLVGQTVLAEDVYVTFDGDVKLLGFKPSGRQQLAGEGGGIAPNGIAPNGGGAPTDTAAVDMLLSTHRSPELAAWLARIGRRISARSSIGLWQVACSLQAWQTDRLRSDGRVELAEAMQRVAPELRATRRAQLEAACSRALSAPEANPNLSSDLGRDPSEEPPPVSGARRITGRWRIDASQPVSARPRPS
jgi:serine/threonine protein kinase